MKFSTIYLDKNIVEIHNSALGKETIIVNNEIVSSKYSIAGTTHNFNILDNGTKVECTIKIRLSTTGIVFGFIKDGKPFIEPAKRPLWPFIVFAFIVGISIGVFSTLN